MTIPQSKIKVDTLEAFDPAGPVTVSFGASVPPGATFNVNGNLEVTGIVTANQHSGTSLTSNGVLTANQLIGSSIGLTALPVIDDSKTIAFTLIA